MSFELRDEPPGGPAAQALFAEYLELVRERLGAGWAPTARVFGTDEAFTGPGAAWLVAYASDDRPVGCGGLRVLEPGVGEIKRMFVTGSARGRGAGRMLLRELERRAAVAGHRTLRLLTTEVLHEALALYEAEGYDLVERIASRPDRPVELWLEKGPTRRPRGPAGA